MKKIFLLHLIALMSIATLGLSHAALADRLDEIAIGGSVTLKSGNTLVVRNGTVDTRVLVNQDTRLINRVGNRISYTDIELGDRIQAFGILVDVRTLVADTIRDVSFPRGTSERTFTGTLSGKNGNELIVRSGVDDTIIILNQDTLILDRVGHRISLSALEIGERIQSFGELINGNIEADTVYDLSVAFAGGVTGILPGAYDTGLAGTLPGGICCSPVAPGYLPGVQSQDTPTGQATITAAPTPEKITIVGILQSQSGNTMYVLSGGTTFTVLLDQNTKGYDRDGKPMSFAKMRNGDTVQVTGTKLSDVSIQAEIVRDLNVSFASMQVKPFSATQVKPKPKKVVKAPVAQKAPTVQQCHWVQVCK